MSPLVRLAHLLDHTRFRNGVGDGSIKPVGDGCEEKTSMKQFRHYEKAAILLISIALLIVGGQAAQT